MIHHKTEKLRSNIKFRFKYITWDKFQVATINAGLTFIRETISFSYI